MTSASHQTASTPNIPTGIQALSVIFYAGFAIPVSIVAMNIFGVLGLALAAFFAWQWGRIPALGGTPRVSEVVQTIRPSVPETGPKPTGNASFDAYRTDMMERLEKEQDNFENFLERLRSAKDKGEFDQFMEDRAEAAKSKD